ncbi:MAG: TolC family protein [Halobacteriovoraceae bacterium]|nr:TolC family protein [Halobacteriovoraceae bacterium]
MYNISSIFQIIIKLNFSFVFILLSTKSIHASVEELFLQSLKESKQVAIINLNEQKSLLLLKNRITSIYPEISLKNTNSYTDQSDTTNSLNSKIALSLEQKLFQGGAEFALLDLKGIIPRQSDAQKKLEFSTYFAQFSNYYFQLSSALKERDTVRDLLKNLEQRVKLVSKRVTIGRDRGADLLALESQLARLKSDLISTEIQIEHARTNFTNFSNLKNIEITQDNIDPLKLVLEGDANLNERPELKNLKLELEVSQAEVKIQKSSYYPQVSLGSNYYVYHSSSNNTNWDISLNVTMPLLDFGERSSAVMVQKIQTKINQAKLDLSVNNSDKIWSNYIKAFGLKKLEFLKLKESLEKSKDAYKEQLKDVEKGLITQIDVIRSLDDVINLEKLVIRSALDLKLQYYQAKAYLGDYPKSE